MDRTFFAFHVLEASVAPSDIMKGSPQRGGFHVNPAQVLLALFPIFMVSLPLGLYFLLLRSNQGQQQWPKVLWEYFEQP